MKKELKEEKEEKDLEKSNKEQKKVLQALQGDIRDIKERMQEIKDMIEGTNLFNLFCVLGSLFVAGGLAIIFATIGYVFHFGIQTLLKYYFFLPLIGGYFMFFAGISMIVGAVYKWIGVKSVEELWHTNKGLFCVFFFLIACAILVALGLMVLTWFT
jgi:hypothetical protein